MLRIAYVTMKLAPFNEGGPAAVAHSLLKNLMKIRDVSITLIVGNSATENDIVTTFGDRFENIVRIPLERSHMYNMYDHVRKMKEVWLAFDHVDLVHVNLLFSFRNFYLPFFAFLKRKSSICTVHSVDEFEILDVFHKQKALAVKVSILRAIRNSHRFLWSRIVVNSKYVKTELSKTFGKEKICLIRNGIDYNKIQKAPKLDLEGDIKLLFVGRIEPPKGLNLLLKALSLLKKSSRKKVRLYIAGSGTHEADYKSLATSLKVHKYAKFLGHLPLDECYSLYKSCDMFILPSRTESCPMTLLEALGSGIPIIATNVGGISEIVKNNRNGLLVGFNSLEIAQKIKFLIDHPEVREQISKNNLIDANKYSWQKIVQQYLDLYKSI